MPLLLLLFFAALLPAASTFDLSTAAIVAPGAAEKTAATVLSEEIEKRSGLRLPIVSTAPAAQPRILLSVQAGGPPEAFHISQAGMQVTLSAATPRGLLYACGALLRKLHWSRARISLHLPIALHSAPVSRLRGHQLGYRSTANSWDAWTVAQFDQYIRELALFGVNAIENIPFQDNRPEPLMKVSRREMNRAMSEICRRYSLDYWVWVPADFDLADAAQRSAFFTRFDEFLNDTPTLSGIFVPGGDPGHNPPSLVLPFLAELAQHLATRHANAKIWLSLQGFDATKEEAVYHYIEQESPSWLGGLVAGPSSPPIARTRARLPARYGLRLYPDITHNKICQYQVPHWDQAYALTLGREAINPRPEEFAAIHNRYAASSIGFLSYSDGVHDDINKIIFSALAWDPTRQPREILIEYARLHFSSDLAPEIADAILALERNWRGPLATNGSVEATLLLWNNLAQRAPQLAANWRWQMCLLRSVYDAYVRRRLLLETQLEKDALREMSQGNLDAALQILARAGTDPAQLELRQRILDLGEQLFTSIGLQTSVKKYGASGAERGAILDFLDYPLNNRWWLEDEIAKLRNLPAAARAARLETLVRWEDPGPGSFYDDIGHEGRSPHAEGDLDIEAGSFRAPEPTFWWWDQGMSRARLSWQSTLWPARVVYEGLDPKAAYVVRSTGHGKHLLHADGKPLNVREEGEFRRAEVPAELLQDGRLELTWRIPSDEEHLNWRQRSRLAEVWLLKQTKP